MSASNRSLLFLLGLVLGLLAGAGFFIFKMDDLIKKTNILNSSKDTLVIQQQAPVVAEAKKNKTDVKKYIGRTDTSQQMNSAELLAKKYSREVPIKRVMAEADSLLRDKDSVSVSNPETLVVRKDEMLWAKNLEVINLQPETANASDSLLEKVSGIKDGKKNVIAAFKVEFWQSPINYKGYKMTKNKIVLFGINSDETIKLFHMDDAIFLKQNQNYVKLYFTDEFRQFEKVTDPSVISKLK